MKTLRISNKILVNEFKFDLNEDEFTVSPINEDGIITIDNNGVAKWFVDETDESGCILEMTDELWEQLVNHKDSYDIETNLIKIKFVSVNN